ncbi:MAG: hypothetical protein ACF8MF_06835 [Phycisphaerales bacterium JB052]
MLAATEGALKQGFTDEELQDIANRALDIVTTRTDKGLDFEDKRFQPYSKRYAKKRAKHGRVTEKVTLLFRGEMMASLTGGPDKGDARLYFSNSTLGQIANYHNSLEPRKVIPFRRFLDFGEKSDGYKKLANMAAQMMASRIEQ